MRIVFFGTADFAVPSLTSLVASGHDVLAVVTQPDKPHGRGMQMSASPVKLAATRMSLPLLQPRRVRSEKFIEQIRNMRPGLLALAAFGQLVPQALLDIPPLGPINVHGSLLPKYRGAAPIQRAIMAGETVTGVTTMWMDATLDTGDILLASQLDIHPNDTTGTLFPRLASLGAALLLETISGLEAGTVSRIPQDGTQATLAPMIQPEDSIILWEETADAIVNRIRALTPKPGTLAEFGGKRVKIWSARRLDDTSGDAPGTVTEISKAPPGVNIAVGSNQVLMMTDVQPDSGKRMAADAWARGVHIRPGDRFEAPKMR